MKYLYLLSVLFTSVTLTSHILPYDDVKYMSVKIGGQEWMMDNLSIAVFRNGQKIPQAKTAAEWEEAGIEERPVWCYYNFDSTNNKKYGKLYNWYAVNDKRGLAPRGWHVATDFEWLKLIDHLEGNEVAGAKLKSTDGWDSNMNGNNNAAFGAQPAGLCDAKGVFQYMGCTAYFWTSTQVSPTEAMDHYITCEFFKMGTAASNKRNGYSCRCIKDR